MFNTGDHEAYVTELARAIADARDETWKQHVNRRYAAYLRILANEAELGLENQIKVGMPDTQKAKDHVDKTRNAIAQHRGFASDLLGGVTNVNAPARCEALCRIFETNRGIKL